MSSKHTPKTLQLTIRGVPSDVKKVFADRAHAERKSLNTLLIETLSLAAGLAPEAKYHDLDHLAGLWEADPEFDKILDEQNRIDEKLWQ